MTYLRQDLAYEIRFAYKNSQNPTNMEPKTTRITMSTQQRSAEAVFNIQAQK